MQNREASHWLPASIMVTDHVVGIVLAWGRETLGLPPVWPSLNPLTPLS